MSRKRVFISLIHCIPFLFFWTLTGETRGFALVKRPAQAWWALQHLGLLSTAVCFAIRKPQSMFGRAFPLSVLRACGLRWKFNLHVHLHVTHQNILKSPLKSAELFQSFLWKLFKPFFFLSFVFMGSCVWLRPSVLNTGSHLLSPNILRSSNYILAALMVLLLLQLIF